jgi:hypothetical protein
MGMFDYLRIGDYCYQTKDLDSFMHNYRIADDLTLEKEEIEYKELPKEQWTEFPKGVPFPTFDEIPLGWSRVPIHRKIIRILGDDALRLPSGNPHGRSSEHYYAYFLRDRLVCLHKQPIFFINIYTADQYTGTYRWDEDNFLADWLEDDNARCYSLNDTIDVRRMLRAKVL